MKISVDALKTIEALRKIDKRIPDAMQFATQQVGMAATSEMKKQITGGHKAGTPTPSVIGSPPTNITGNLRRAIRATYPIGFRGYSVIVGSFAIYARQVEQGGGNWRNGARYPFVEPTARIMLQEKKAQNIYSRAIRKALDSK